MSIDSKNSINLQKSTNPLKIIPCLSGPTCSGKSASALHLAQKYPIEIIVVDSATIYKEMDIGTAKPSISEQNTVPHHLIDIRDPSQSYSVSEFKNDTLSLIQSILKRGKIPLLVGGTMMYLKTLRDGLHDLPSSDPNIRAFIETQASLHGWQKVHNMLSEVDPITASRLSPNDSQRISRAYEIYLISKKPMSTWLSEDIKKEHDYQFHIISLESEDRSTLHNKIKERFLKMCELGFLEEVQKLKQRNDLHADLPSIRCVGYKQMWEHLNGEYDYKTAIEKGIAATRQLAKRQFTWLRSMQDRTAIDCFAHDVTKQVEQKFKEIVS